MSQEFKSLKGGMKSVHMVHMALFLFQLFPFFKCFRGNSHAEQQLTICFISHCSLSTGRLWLAPLIRGERRKRGEGGGR